MNKDKKNMMEEIHADFDDTLEYMRFTGYDQGLNAGREIGIEEGYALGRGPVILPHPCDGPLYDEWTPDDHLAKGAEEYYEVLKAFTTFRESGKPEDEFKFFNECTDLQVAIVSMMDRLGCPEAERQFLMKRVNESNAKRDEGRRFKKE